MRKGQQEMRKRWLSYSCKRLAPPSIASKVWQSRLVAGRLKMQDLTMADQTVLLYCWTSY